MRLIELSKVGRQQPFVLGYHSNLQAKAELNCRYSLSPLKLYALGGEICNRLKGKNGVAFRELQSS
jgi:hypothetical protein